MVGDLNGGLPHAAGARMDENALPALHARQMVDGVMCGEKDGGQRGGLFKADVVGQLEAQILM
ncbi:MAG: hypothetical protein R2851_23930 [Caldilineaceae bacterium]